MKRHAFFCTLDWDKLLRQEYRSPFQPIVSGTLDFRHIDPTFTAAPIPRSLRREAGEPMTGFTATAASMQDAGLSANLVGTLEMDQAFMGFSFQPANSQLDGVLEGAEAEEGDWLDVDGETSTSKFHSTGGELAKEGSKSLSGGRTRCVGPDIEVYGLM